MKTSTVILFALSACCSFAQFKVLDRWRVGGDGGWDYLTIESGSKRLFISRFDRMEVVSLETGKVVGTIPNLKGVHQAVFDTKVGRGFTSNGGEDSVTVFDLKTLKEIGRVSVGKRPDAIIFDPASERVFTFNAESQDATAVDCKTMKVIGSVALGGRPEFPAVDGVGHIFCNIESTSEIFEFDATSLKAIKRWPIAPGEGPSGLAIDAKHHRLFSVTDGKMIVSDTEVGKVVTSVPVGHGPDAAAFDPGTGMAYSSNGEGTLTIVHEDSPDKYSVIQNLPTQRSARTCVLDPRTHRVYLVAAETKQIEGQRRRQVVPGSFVVIVVGKE